MKVVHESIDKGKMVLSGYLVHKGFIIIIIETFFSLLRMLEKIPHLMNARRMLDKKKHQSNYYFAASYTIHV